MCVTCGCGSDHDHVSHDDHHHHGNSHTHSHSHSNGNHDVQDKLINLEKDILYENSLLAQRNRGYLDGKNIFGLNIVSSPGSGKTMLLELTLKNLNKELSFYVIEGDQQTSLDADRIKATGTKAVQVNTGKGCHLDAHMVLHAIQDLKPENNSVLFIENVGNLVCPSMFDLGENERVVVMSVTEGDDKPIKYPDMFHTSGVCIINKTDLLPYVPFDMDKAIENAKKINPKLQFFQVSCTTGEGLDAWYDWLRERTAELKPA